jgi:hypothetical protein
MHVAAASAATNRQITAQQVSAAVLNRAQGDGDGRKGVAALNDGDAAAQSAAQQVKAQGKVNITA